MPQKKIYICMYTTIIKYIIMKSICPSFTGHGGGRGIKNNHKNYTYISVMSGGMYIFVYNIIIV